MEQFRNVCQLFTEKWKYVKRTEMCSASATMWSKLIVISMEYVFCVYFVYWEQPNGKILVDTDPVVDWIAPTMERECVRK